jgi:flagellar protein FlaG
MDISSISNLPPPAPVSDSAAAAPASSAQRASTQTLIQAIKAVNAVELFGPENELTYVKDSTSHRIVTRVVNRESHEVVLQIPSDEVLRMAEESTGGQFKNPEWQTASTNNT